MSLRRLALGTLGLSASLSGCSDPGAPGGLLQERAAIVEGESADGVDEGVVSIYTRTGGCSGSLIAPNVVLTALHCVAEISPGKFSCDNEGNLSSSTPNGGALGGLVEPETIAIRLAAQPAAAIDAHGLQIFGTGSLSSCRNDLAAIVLDTELSAPLVPMRFDRATKQGERVRAVGYGTTMTDAGGRHVRHGLVVAEVGDDGTTEGSRYAAPYTLVIGEGPCHGDSGGPLLSEDTNAVIGVYSLLLSSSCQGTGIRNAYTQVAPFESTIMKALDYAGYPPVIEGSSGSGAGGSAGAPGQAGETGTGEAGGAPGSAGESATGGSTSGGSSTGGTGGSDATGGTGGSDGGASTTGGSSGFGSGAKSTGSGSRRDPSCACRTVGGPDSGSASTLPALFLAGLALLLRRRHASR